jgi:hypothetical protein
VRLHAALDRQGADKVAVSSSTLLMDLVTLTLVLTSVPSLVSTRLYVP